MIALRRFEQHGQHGLGERIAIAVHVDAAEGQLVNTGERRVHQQQSIRNAQQVAIGEQVDADAEIVQLWAGQCAGRTFRRSDLSAGKVATSSRSSGRVARTSTSPDKQRDFRLLLPASA